MSMGNGGSFSRRQGGLVRLAAAFAGAVYLVLPSCEGILRTFNPGGTVFSTFSAQDLDAFLGDVPDWNLDPTCTVPYYGIRTGDTGGGCGDNLIYPVTPGPRPAGEP